MKLNLFIAGVLLLALLLVANVHAKAQTVNNDPATITGTGSTANFGRVLDAQVGSMRFVGKVVMEGGRLPWDLIPVVVICDGKTSYNTVADKKGEFDIEATPRESEAVGSKRDPQHVDPSQLVGCKVSAILEGFQSTSVMIMNGSIMDDPDVGTITLRKDARATGSIVSDTTLSAPQDAQKEFEEARAAKADRHFDRERSHLQSAVTIDPQFAEAWYQLGKLEEKDKPQDALNAYEKAAAADPNYIPPYERIAALAAAQKRWQEVADAANHALQLNPAGTPQIWYFSAVGNFNLGHGSVAESSALTALSLDPSHRAAPKTEQLLAVILDARKEYKGALEHLRNCLTYTPPGPESDLIKRQVAQLEKVVPQAAK